MKYFLVIVLALVSWNDPIKIGKINRAKEEAKKAYEAGDFKKAAATYRYLIDSLGVNEDEVTLNLANALYSQKDTAQATSVYQSLMSSTKGPIVSKASQQLGVMANEKGKAEEALSLFKQAIKNDPSNQDARYNYELLKKKLDEKKKQEDNKKNKDKEKKDQNKNEEASEFAKKLKEQADRLVAQRQYKEAYDLMTEGIKKDKTVATYQKYIDRIGDVIGIVRKK